MITYNYLQKLKRVEFPQISTSPCIADPTSGGVVTLKSGRREVTGSNSGRACRPSRSEFSVVFSEIRVST